MSTPPTEQARIAAAAQLRATLLDYFAREYWTPLEGCLIVSGIHPLPDCTEIPLGGVGLDNKPLNAGSSRFHDARHMWDAWGDYRESQLEEGEEAYVKILAKAGSDTEIQVMLVRSQKRWISARDKGFDGTMDVPGAPDKGALAQSLLQAMRSRTAELTETSHANPALPHLIELASAQRKFLGQFTGGAFAGFDMNCDFLPGGGTLSYGCFGVRRYQNLDRVCMVQDDWASGHVSQVQSVAKVVRGKLEEVAVCGDGEADAGQCPDAGNPDDPAAQWNRHPAQSPGRTASSQNWPQLDTDADAGAVLDWLRVCLTDSHYPPAQVAKQSGK
ncbi:hypothetical protein PQQ86_13865 [Paraburkholderia sediminicola]|uniref:hypothetical protein n=1 Tax=Paraburkholderia sediminicola TaxID=458836 RepID=UPI0038B7A7AA